MREPGSRTRDLVAAAGLTLGAVLGLAGTFASQPAVRQILWALDGVGIVVACALLAMRFVRGGEECLAAGFLVFGIGESLLLSGTAAGLEGSVPAFAGGFALWAAGLVLISVPKGFALWARGAGGVAAVLFFGVAARIFLGERLVATARPLPFFAYPFLVLAMAGWILALVRGAAGDDPAGRA